MWNDIRKVKSSVVVGLRTVAVIGGADMPTVKRRSRIVARGSAPPTARQIRVRDKLVFAGSRALPVAA